MDAQPKRVIKLDSHVIAYLGDYMINLKKSLRNIITSAHIAVSKPNGQSSTSSSHRDS